MEEIDLHRMLFCQTFAREATMRMYVSVLRCKLKIKVRQYFNMPIIKIVAQLTCFTVDASEPSWTCALVAQELIAAGGAILTRI